MSHELSFRIALAALLGLIAAGGNLLGGYFVVYREWPRRYLQYFLALGAGYMLSVAIVEVIPESVHLGGESALMYVLAGFFLVHLFEHTIAPHFHFGEETHTEEMQHGHAQVAVFLHKLPEGFTVASVVMAKSQNKRNAIRAAGLLGAATLAGVLLTSQLQGQLKYALPLSGGVTLYVAATDLLPEVNKEPNWRMALLVFVGVATMLIMRYLFNV